MRVILTKDNVIIQNWNGNESCCFYDHKKSIQHLFFECPLAKIIWHIIHMTFRLAPPKNVTNIFENWLKGIPKNDLIQIRVGVCAIIWAIRNTRNDWVFNKSKKFFLAGYPYDLPLDPYVVFSLTRGAAGGDEFWVQSYEDVSLGFIQSVRLVVAQ
jgi:hypothetical protein